MEYSAQRSIRITLCALLISVAISGAAVAQSGSAGGSIGNDEKSLSGSRAGAARGRTLQAGASRQT